MKITLVTRLKIGGGVLAAVVASSAALATNPSRHPVFVAPKNTGLDSNGIGFSLPPGYRTANRMFRSPLRGARPSYAIRRHGRQQTLIGYNSQIQHIVVIEMENRTPENLFGAYWNTKNPATGNTFGNDLNVVNPQSVPNMYAMPLEGTFDPDHSHEPAFVNDVKGNWNSGSVAYVPTPAPGSTSLPEVANYISLIENWAYANTVLQSNEGPSFPSHQYAISGQSGGLGGSSIAPNGLIENPGTPMPMQSPSKDDIAIGGGSCATTAGAKFVPTTNMNAPYPGNENGPGQATPPPCNDYSTIFDLLTNNQPNQPPYDLWQYIAEDTNIIWSGPMAVKHLYQNYVSGTPVQAVQPFAADPDAQNFVANLTNNKPNPVRPFAALTYITPCVSQSDHPNKSGISNGPQWLAWVVNAIGQSPYWPNTAIIVTWDDWGGFYDNYQASPWPFHPNNNGYHNPNDPNEWGFRVPFIVISPWVTQRGYLSSNLRSQGAILSFVEEAFLQPNSSLFGDDYANSKLNRPIDDIFNLERITPGLPYVTLPTTFTPSATGACP